MAKITSKTKGYYYRERVCYLDKQIDGIRIRERIGPVSDKLAQQILSKRINEVVEGQYLPAKSNRSLTVNDALSTYWNDRLQFKVSSKTRKYLLTTLADRIGDQLILRLTIAHIEKYKRLRLNEFSRSGRPIKPRTVNDEISLLNTALNWLIKNRIIYFNPIVGFEKADEGEREIRVLDNGEEDGNEWKMLYFALPKHIKPIIFCQYKTGMRIGEVLKLEWSWIDLFRKLIFIPGSATKTRRKRIIPISSDLLELFFSLNKEGQYVFTNANTGVPYNCVRKAFDNAVKRAGIRKITTHCLRKTRATIWNELDEAATMKAIGHTTKEVHYGHYARIGDERLLRLVK